MRAHAVRLAPGTDLKLALASIARERGIGAGCILTCVGSLSRARLRAPGSAGKTEALLAFEGPMEIVSCVGTLGPDGAHVHLSLSLPDGYCVGGHLMEGCLVHTTAEVVIGELPNVEFRRGLDEATGYRELVVGDEARGS